MRRKNFLLSFMLRGISIFPGIFFALSVSSSQVIRVFPQVDSLALWGTCTPPEFKCTLTQVGQDTDRIVLRPYSSELICGLPPGKITARYDCAYFQVRDSMQLNRYELWYTNFSIYHPDRFIVPFDSTVWSLSGPCTLILRVLRGTAIVDSAILNFYSYQTGLGVEKDPRNIPRKLVLLQNYPNPFNPSTKISYFLPHSGHVRLEIFDLRGRPIEIPVDQVQGSGVHSIQWGPRTLSSGVYIITLTTRNAKSVVKCQFLK